LVIDDILIEKEDGLLLVRRVDGIILMVCFLALAVSFETQCSPSLD